MWEWILKVWGNGGRNIQLNQAEFVDMGPLSGDLMFNMEARTVKKGVKSLFKCLAELFFKRQPNARSTEVLEPTDHQGYQECQSHRVVSPRESIPVFHPADWEWILLMTW